MSVNVSQQLSIACPVFVFSVVRTGCFAAVAFSFVHCRTGVIFHPSSEIKYEMKRLMSKF